MTYFICKPFIKLELPWVDCNFVTRTWPKVVIVTVGLQVMGETGEENCNRFERDGKRNKFSFTMITISFTYIAIKIKPDLLKLKVRKLANE
jgi:hypothetical protein